MGAAETKDMGENPQRFRRANAEPNIAACPARVDSVKIAGLRRTHNDYITRSALGLFQVKTFEDLLIECQKARNYLTDLGIYKDIRVEIAVSSGDKATPNGYEVTFKGTELPRVQGAVGTEVGQNEGSMTVELTTPNMWGRGERLGLHGSYSNSKTTDVTLRLTKPFFHTSLGDYRPKMSFGVFRHATAVPVSSYITENVGILADLKFILPLSPQITHSLQYELSVREISTLGKQSPFFVCQNCGPRMASLVRHIMSFDQRDCFVFPTRGFYVKCTNELSGLGGNIPYVMNNLHAEISLPLFAGISAQLTSRLGIIQKINKNQPEPPIGSLYTLGGPLSLRGFQFGGVGPQCNGFASGAHSYWAAGLHLWSPLPFSAYLGRFGSNFRTHLFYNFGNCDSYSLEKMRSAAGLGIALRLGERARIELNYCYPIDKQKSDRSQAGVQFGIGYEFI